MVCTIKCIYKKMLSRYVQPKGTRCVDNGIEKKYQNRRLIAHAQGISRTLTARPGGVNQPQKGDLTPAGETIKVKEARDRHHSSHRGQVSSEKKRRTT
jgi:hypothetical protein